MSENNGQYRKNITIGSSVGITTRENRNTIIKGEVANLLTNSDFHTHGIMVTLKDGTIGRVKEIYDYKIEIENESNAQEVSKELVSDDPLSIDRVPTHATISINEDDTGYSYKNLFYPYLKDASKITIEDAYIRIEYQIKNLVYFCTLLTGRIEDIDLHLVTSSADSSFKSEQIRKFNELKENLKNDNVNFSFSFEDNLHDRVIKTDTGWRIIPGRGLDIFQDPGSYYSPANFDQTKKKCKKTEIVYIRNL